MKYQVCQHIRLEPFNYPMMFIILLLAWCCSALVGPRSLAFTRCLYGSAESSESSATASSHSGSTSDICASSACMFGSPCLLARDNTAASRLVDAVGNMSSVEDWLPLGGTGAKQPSRMKYRVRDFLFVGMARSLFGSDTVMNMLCWKHMSRICRKLEIIISFIWLTDSRRPGLLCYVPDCVCDERDHLANDVRLQEPNRHFIRPLRQGPKNFFCDFFRIFQLRDGFQFFSAQRMEMFYERLPFHVREEALVEHVCQLCAILQF